MRGQKQAYKPARGHPAGPGEPVTSNRAPVNKSASAREFRGHVAKSKALNFEAGGMRGGWRL